MTSDSTIRKIKDVSERTRVAEKLLSLRAQLDRQILRKDLDRYREYFDVKVLEGKTEPQIEKYYLTNWRTFQISDHLPLWIELKIDFSNQYLAKIR